MREAGVLMPVSSVPGLYGIGDFGAGSYAFVDWLKKTGASIWQILPLNPLGYGNSPYQPFSSYAGDEIYISLERLFESGLLKEKTAPFLADADRVAYDKVRHYKTGYLKEAFRNFKKDEKYNEFIAQEWVYLYAVFYALKEQNHQRCWNEWPRQQKNWILDRKYDISALEESIQYEMFIQYIFYCQWKELKDYANAAGIRIMGDVPFYVGIDSLDVWANRENFLLDAEGKPTFIAGVPPDCFSEDGQRWGNPIYDWDYMEQDGFRFWVDRLKYCNSLFDIIRIDHFRAFDTYWKIPASSLTAIEGEWIKAPGYKVFDTILKEIPDIQLIAEDLGADRPSVYQLRDFYGLKGMKLTEFLEPFDKDVKKIVNKPVMAVYTGTHDNQTVMGWYHSMTENCKAAWGGYLEAYGFGNGEEETFAKAMVGWTLADIADLAVIPMQDILGLDDSARMNEPGTLGSPNWEWRLRNLESARDALPFISKAVKDSGRAAENNGYTEKKVDLLKLLETILKYLFNKTLIACDRDELNEALEELVRISGLK